MTKLTVNASRTYEVVIGPDLLRQTGELSAGLIAGRTAVIVSDDNVFPLYGEIVRDSLEHAGFRAESFVFPAGEESKNPDTLIRLLNFLAEQQVTRADALFALGGGVTGDLTGLAAALYQRGIACVQLPTTLLAAVDSSVGGKTAVNLAAGKNLMGAFSQPVLVLCDTDTMMTLPQMVYAEGWAEVIKYAMIRSRDLALILKDLPVGADLEAVIAACVGIKRDVVMSDEFDTGERQILNFGHTVGHAIEKCSEYQIPHGIAVAIGMAVMTRACTAAGTCGEECMDVLTELLEKFHLPLTCDLDVFELLKAARSDKKRSGDSITLVLPKTVGECILKKTDFDELEQLVMMGI